MKKNIQHASDSLNKPVLTPEVISYITIQNVVGILGVLLPIVLVFGSLLFGHVKEVLPSISTYYHSNMRDFFVGLLCAVALFLFAYKGYDNRDNIAGNLGCIFAVGVAFFPTSNGDPIVDRPDWIGIIHLFFAAMFFLVLIYFSVFLFTKTDKKVLSKQKKNFNLVYKSCGYCMLGCIVLIALYLLILEKIFPMLADGDPVFWLEAISLWAFGISWLTKGKIRKQILGIRMFKKPLAPAG